MRPTPALLGLEPGRGLAFPGRNQVASVPTPGEGKRDEGEDIFFTTSQYQLFILFIQQCLRLPRTTGTAVFPQQRWSRYGCQAAYQTTDPRWDGPEKEKPAN